MTVIREVGWRRSFQRAHVSGCGNESCVAAPAATKPDAEAIRRLALLNEDNVVIL